MSAKAKIAVIYYSTYGHITKLTEAIVAGAKATGAHVDVFQFPETLSADILAKQYAIPRPDVPVIGPHQLTEYDGYIMGFPTRYGRAPAQVSAFFDSTGKEWQTGALVGKFGTFYTSAASQHGGLETTALTSLPFFIHHGISYVPTGYATSDLQRLDELVGGSAYGAGTIAGGDGSRQPTESDLKVARAQGDHFCNIVNTFAAGRAAIARHAASTHHTTSAAENMPTSATIVPAVMHVKPTNGGDGYAVDSSSSQTNGAPEPVNATAPAAPVSATTEKESAAPTTAKKQQKKGSIFARCCGSEKDYAK